MIANNEYIIENGLYVFTREYLLKRGYCCYNGCRNCPYKQTKNMEKMLYMEGEPTRKVVVQHDDLKFDGKTMQIPGYWANTLAEFLRNIDESKIAEEDREDLELLKSFVFDTEYSKNQGN